LGAAAIGEGGNFGSGGGERKIKQEVGAGDRSKEDLTKKMVSSVSSSNRKEKGPLKKKVLYQNQFTP